MMLNKEDIRFKRKGRKIMVRHVVSWNYKDEIESDKKQKLNMFFKNAFLDLKEKVPGVLNIEVGAPPLDSSSKELCLYVEMTDEHILLTYRDHPDHVAIAEIIKDNCKDRCCVDFLGN